MHHHSSIRRGALALLLLLTVLSVGAQDAVRAFLRESGVNPSRTAVLVTDLVTGDTLAAHNPSMPLIPASIMKSVTVGALLQSTGPDFEYHTCVYADGPMEKGVLRGNIVVVGSGDPSLGSKVDPTGTDVIAEVTDVLKRKGIKAVEGDIVVDQSAWSGPSCPPGWAKGDLSCDYGTGSHALNFDNNTRGKSSVADPSAVFRFRLVDSLSKAGITLKGGHLDSGKRTLLLDHVSPPIDEIMRSCMMRSDNMMAESMLRTYSVVRGGDGSTASGAEFEKKLWGEKGLPMDGVVISDGSGLSRSNRVTADFMASLLKQMSYDVYYASFFPLAGKEGTLKKFLTDTSLDSYIAMKTGSMTGIQCYAGYKLDDEYAPTHAVVIIVNELSGSRDTMRKAAERMLLTLFQEK